MPDDNSQDLISGGHLVAKALKAEGVEVIYTLCGGHIIDIYDGCVDEGIEVVDVRHEQVAAHAADGYARITGKPGCAVVTAGPGTTDAVTGVANAFRAESPMLLIGGQGAHTQHKMGSLQDLPHVDMMTPITKFAATVPDTARAADMVSMAFRECYHGAPGPSFLEIPRDVLDAKVPGRQGAGPGRRPLPGLDPLGRRPRGHREARRPARARREAGDPAGQPGVDDPGHRAAIDLVRTLNVPAYMNGAGRGTLPPGDPHHFQLSRRYAFSNADLIVIVGTPFDFRMGYGKRLSPDATVVQIDLDYRTVGKNRDIDLGIVGDAGLVLKSVTEAASGRINGGSRRSARSGWTSCAPPSRPRIEKRLPQLKSDASPIHPYRLVSEINDFLTEDSIYIGDGGDIVTFSGQVVQPKSPGHWMDPGPLGTLGVGVPFVLAAKQARPDKEVVALFGDGAFSPDRLGLRDARPLQPPVRRHRRQQLLDEPDPLRPEGQVRRGARAGRQHPRRRPLRQVRADAGRLRRGGPRPRRHRARAAARPRVRQAVADQRLGRPGRVRPRNHEPDHVQVR